MRKSDSLYIAAFVLYGLAFWGLYPLWDNASGILTVVPVGLVAVLRGMRAGLVGVVVSMAITWPLLIAIEQASLLEWVVDGGLLGLGALIATVLTVGYFQSLRKNLHEQLALREQAESALRDQEERYRVTAENAKQGIVVALDEELLYANPAFGRIYGLEKTSLTGTPQLGTLVPDATLEAIRQLASEGLAADGTHATRTVETQLTNGSQCTVDIVVAQAATRMGHATIVFFDDVTEARSREALLKEAQQKAEESLTQVTAMQGSLIASEKAAVIGRLVAGVAHELNNPLAAVLGYSELLQHELKGQNAANSVEIIASQAQRAARIVKDLLVSARETGPERRPLDLNALIERVAEVQKYSLSTKNIGLTLDLSSTLPPIVGDEHELQSVLFNLISNAEDAIDQAGRDGVITISTRHELDKVHIVVDDNGTGIQAKHLGHIFDPFFTTKEVGSGTGLGLSTTRAIVSGHDGQISIDSQVGEGTTVRVELPVPQEELEVQAPIAQPDGQEGDGTGRQAKALIVDDEAVIRELMTDILKTQGVEVETVASAEEAVAFLESNEPDVLFLDLRMPGMGGAVFYESLVHESPAVAARTVFVTGDLVSADNSAFLASASRPVIAKPFGVQQVLKALDEALIN